ncbi:hypothetical protein JCM10212_006434, partial [Sporobolomyces blumeae]
DWTSSEADLVREALEQANLVQRNFEPGKLVFVKEPAAIAHFVRRHASSNHDWLKEGASFVLCDAAELGVSIIGYTVVEAAPRLKLQAYDPMTRLSAGVDSILSSFRDFLTVRLAKTKFKSSSIFRTTLVEEFRTKVLPSFAGADGEQDTFMLRTVPEGMEKEVKGALGLDTGAKIRDGWMTLTSEEVETICKPSIDAVIVRLSSTLPKGSAKHILLAGGFGESPYLVRRVKDTFEYSGVRVIVPDIPAHTAVSEGALRFYLSETLRPRPAPYSIGIKVAVDGAYLETEDLDKGQVLEGNGGRRLIKYKFAPILRRGAIPVPGQTFEKVFHTRYRLSANDPRLVVSLFVRDPAVEDDVGDGSKPQHDGGDWLEYRELEELTVDLSSLVASSPVYGFGETAWVVLEVRIVIYVGQEALEAVVAWVENGKEKRSAPYVVPVEYF